METQTEEAPRGRKSAPPAKKATAKAPVKAKAATEKKAKATVKATGNGRGRKSPYAPTAKIKILNSKPPFRVGTVRQNVFDLYEKGMTVEAARAAGVPLNHMKWHQEQGWIEIK